MFSFKDFSLSNIEQKDKKEKCYSILKNLLYFVELHGVNIVILSRTSSNNSTISDEQKEFVSKELSNLLKILNTLFKEILPNGANSFDKLHFNPNKDLDLDVKLLIELYNDLNICVSDNLSSWEMNFPYLDKQDTDHLEEMRNNVLPSNKTRSYICELNLV